MNYILRLIYSIDCINGYIGNDKTATNFENRASWDTRCKYYTFGSLSTKWNIYIISIYSDMTMGKWDNNAAKIYLSAL